MQGRCAGEGCGFEDSYKRALAHVQRCPAFAELYVNDPDRALDPAAEFNRVAADRRPQPAARASAPKPPERSPSPARVPVPKRSAPVLGRERGPVGVEYWGIPSKLVD